MFPSLLLLFHLTSLLLHTTLTFSSDPPATCRYQGYTFNLLHTYSCTTYGLCYCQVLEILDASSQSRDASSRDNVGEDGSTSKVVFVTDEEGFESGDEAGDYLDWNDRTRKVLEAAADNAGLIGPAETPKPDLSDLATAPPLTSPSSTSSSQLSASLFQEWRPQPPNCACWCSALSFEGYPDEPYQPEDSCIIDETDCYCGFEVDLLWDHRRKRPVYH